jgi:hypothetical protein
MGLFLSYLAGRVLILFQSSLVLHLAYFSFISLRKRHRLAKYVRPSTSRLSSVLYTFLKYLTEVCIESWR